MSDQVYGTTSEEGYPVLTVIRDQPDEEHFYADDFFAMEDDPGVKVFITMRGRQVPIHLKRGLTLEDEMAAQSAALKKTITPEGKIVVEGLDESALVVEMLYRQINRWPFTNRTTGQKLPITRENIKRMLGGAEELAEAIKKLNAEGEAALAPFGVASAER